jgi:hypothetical protein
MRRGWFSLSTVHTSHQRRRHISCSTTSQTVASLVSSFQTVPLNQPQQQSQTHYLYLDHYQRRHRRLSSTCVRPQSTLTTNAFWKSLDDAVENGDGASALEIVDQAVQEYKSQLQQVNNNNAGVNGEAPLDRRMFSMVLQAWKNGPCASVESAMKAQNLLSLMFSFAEKGVIEEQPTVLDYLTVLECWSQASADDDDDDAAKSTIWKHAEEIWSLVPQDAVSNGYKEKFYQTLIDILANAGQGELAEQYLEEYKQRQLADNTRRKHQAAVVESNMCLSVLHAHLNSMKKEAFQRAEEFLSRMQADPFLPRPSIEFYNILLESWAMPAKKRDFSIAAENVERLLEEMKKARVQPDTTSYQYALEVLARLGEGIRAEALLTSLVKEYTNQFDAGLKPGIKPFRTVLWAYSNSHHPDAATYSESILNNMEELSQSDFDTYPTTWDYNLVLKCWSRSRSPDAVEHSMQLYEKMVASTASDKNTENKMEEESTDRVRLPPKPDTTTINTLLQTAGRREPAFQLEKLLWKFLDRHLSDPANNPCPDTISFSTVMKCWGRSRDYSAPEQAEKLLRKLESLYAEGKEECKPDIYLYSLLMNCWSKSRNKKGPWRVESIFRNLQTMARNGNIEMTPDAACWNTAINAWIGDGQRAEALFMEMIETKQKNSNAAVSPTPITLTNVMNAWAKTRSSATPARAVSLLRKLERFYEDGVIDVKPHVVCYSLALESLALDRTLAAAMEADDMLREMLASGDPDLKPNVVCYNCVIKAWAFSGHPEAFGRASALLTEVIRQSQGDEKMKPTVKTFGGVLKCLAQSNVPDKKKRAQALVGLMKKFDINQDRWTQNVLTDCVGKEKSSERNPKSSNLNFEN